MSGSGMYSCVSYLITTTSWSGNSSTRHFLLFSLGSKDFSTKNLLNFEMIPADPVASSLSFFFTVGSSSTDLPDLYLSAWLVLMRDFAILSAFSSSSFTVERASLFSSELFSLKEFSLLLLKFENFSSGVERTETSSSTITSHQSFSFRFY